MDRIACMKSFVRVVETGSFSAVAREMETTQPSISKQIAALENYLDVQLLTRSTRHLSLTEAGDRFYEHCQQVLEVVAAAEASVGQRQQPTGVVRVSCPVSLGQLKIVPLLKPFFDRFPDVKVDLIMTDQFIDLVEAGVDLAIRVGHLQDTNLITRQIGVTRRVTVGTPAYFAQAGEPQIPEDLVDHNCIVYTHLATGNEWHFQQAQATIKVRVNGRFQANNSAAIRAAVLAGLGVAVSPIWLFGDAIHCGDLKVVLQNYQPVPLPIYAVYRRSRFQPAKVQCLIDFLADEFRHDPWISVSA
uniref:LysR family transcriptional regulator n=1 Tax=Oscillatoriales cyanobacterium SpSt-402 TaxID=2282168 RepID=A0A832H0U9_9CYAN